MNNDPKYRTGYGNYIIVTSKIAEYLNKLQKKIDREKKIKRILN